VRLGRGQGYAIIDEESFDRLAINGVSERWNLNASEPADCGADQAKSAKKFPVIRCQQVRDGLVPRG
jgi:hypothetical protein